MTRTDPAFSIAGQHPADRLWGAQKLTSSVYLHQDPPPTRNQVAAVLHALADHGHITHLLSDQVAALGQDLAHLGDGWRHATGVGRYFQALGDHLQTFDPEPEPGVRPGLVAVLAAVLPDASLAEPVAHILTGLNPDLAGTLAEADPYPCTVHQWAVHDPQHGYQTYPSRQDAHAAHPGQPIWRRAVRTSDWVPAPTEQDADVAETTQQATFIRAWLTRLTPNR